jgi:ABC-type Fe3+/spermidine/putrescine transport system ATPase subunit
VAEFIGTMNRLASTVVADGVVDHGGHRLPVTAAQGLPPGEKVLLLVRPETVEVSLTNGESTPDGAFAGEVVSHIFLGSTTRIRIEDESTGSSMIADVGTARAEPLVVGARVSATFPRDSARLLSLAEQPEQESPAEDPDDH